MPFPVGGDCDNLEVSDGPRGYLRRFDADLDGALGLVIADAQTAGLSADDAEALVRRLAEARMDYIECREAGGEIALHVAEQVQEHVMEVLRRIPWPGCPKHPDTHPLWLAIADGPDAAWTCAEANYRIQLGELRGASI